MMYNLLCEHGDEANGTNEVVRQALHFFGDIEEASIDQNGQIIEIRIHRIEHRQRIRKIEVGTGCNGYEAKSQNSLRYVDEGLPCEVPLICSSLCDGGILEPGFPQRRYKYQLLDAVDSPYATFRFYYRTLEYLKSHGVVEGSFSRASSTTASVEYHDASSTLTRTCRPGDGSSSTAGDASSVYSVEIPRLSRPDASGGKTTSSDANIPPSDSEESLSHVTRDSIEDLPSSVPRSPKSPTALPQGDDSPQTFEAILRECPDPTASPSRSPTKIMSSMSPRRLFKKKLTVNIGGAEFNLERKKRPLSPFTSGGMLRKLVPATPPSAPPTLTHFGPTVRDEVQKLEERYSSTKGNVDDDRECADTVKRTTRAERGGRQLMNFLNRRIANHP
jgi:hypothetical protein